MSMSIICIENNVRNSFTVEKLIPTIIQILKKQKSTNAQNKPDLSNNYYIPIKGKYNRGKNHDIQ